jgi:hypothetical protein
MGEPPTLPDAKWLFDTAESWVNAGGLLERLNFGLSLASIAFPGHVDPKAF